MKANRVLSSAVEVRSRCESFRRAKATSDRSGSKQMESCCGRRRTKATLIYRKTKNLRAVQLLLGHSDIASTVRYLGIEVDDALEISESVEI